MMYEPYQNRKSKKWGVCDYENGNRIVLRETYEEAVKFCQEINKPENLKQIPESLKKIDGVW